MKRAADVQPYAAPPAAAAPPAWINWRNYLNEFVPQLFE